MVKPLARHTMNAIFPVWVLLSICSLVASCGLFCVAQQIPLDLHPLILAVLMITGFRFWPTVVELYIGNVNLFLLLVIVSMMACDRFGRWKTFAASLVLGILIKTWMIALMFHLLVRRKWFSATLALIGTLTSLAILFTYIGWHEFPEWITVTRNYSSQPQLASNSILGIARMFFAVNPHIVPFATNRLLFLGSIAIGYGLLIGGLLYLFQSGPKMSADASQLSLAMTAAAVLLGLHSFASMVLRYSPSINLADDHAAIWQNRIDRRDRRLFLPFRSVAVQCCS